MQTSPVAALLRHRDVAATSSRQCFDSEVGIERERTGTVVPVDHVDRAVVVPLAAEAAACTMSFNAEPDASCGSGRHRARAGSRCRPRSWPRTSRPGTHREASFGRAESGPSGDVADAPVVLVGHPADPLLHALEDRVVEREWLLPACAHGTTVRRSHPVRRAGPRGPTRSCGCRCRLRCRRRSASRRRTARRWCSASSCFIEEAEGLLRGLPPLALHRLADRWRRSASIKRQRGEASGHSFRRVLYLSSFIGPRSHPSSCWSETRIAERVLEELAVRRAARACSRPCRNAWQTSAVTPVCVRSACRLPVRPGPWARSGRWPQNRWKFVGVERTVLGLVLRQAIAKRGGDRTDLILDSSSPWPGSSARRPSAP